MNNGSMPNHSFVPDDIAARYEVFEWRNGIAILSAAHPEKWADILAVLRGFSFSTSDVMKPGGAKGLIASKLDSHFTQLGWAEKKFETKIVVDEAEHAAPTHKVDCYKDRVALEVEWNNKDPFYDRDLENFKRLHADGAISVGIIVTRGKSLQDNMRNLVGRFFDERQIQTFKDLLRWGYDPTAKQRAAINKRMERANNPLSFREAFVDKFVSDKFGEATTHWRKLEERVSRGVGNPCPLVLIGLPDQIITFGESEKAVKEIIANAVANESLEDIE